MLTREDKIKAVILVILIAILGFCIHSGNVEDNKLKEKGEDVFCITKYSGSNLKNLPTECLKYFIIK